MGKLKSKHVIAKENIAKGKELLKELVQERDGLKDTLKNEESNDNYIILSQKSLKESLEVAIYSQKKLEEELSILKDELMDTYDQYFEKEKEQVVFLDLI